MPTKAHEISQFSSLTSATSNDAVSPMQQASSSGDHEDQIHGHNKVATFKRSKRPTLKVLPGQIVFRLVCHTSIVGGLIGSSGSIVSQLRRETSCRIHCEDGVPGTDDRVIIVIGSSSTRKGVILKSVAGEDDGGEVEVEVSSAQEAVLRVFERVWDLIIEKSANKVINGEVWCKLLAHTSQIGAVVGKGGLHIMTIREYSGAKIRIFPAPHCATKDDELIHIMGGILAVKKALIAVSGCLQDCPPLDKVSVPLSSLTISSPDRASPDLNTELFPHLTSWLLAMQGKSPCYDALERTMYSGGASVNDIKGTEHEVTFRLLCPNSVAGGVIGKRGAIVRALESKTGASIIFAAPLSKYGERIVTISALENLEFHHSPAQDAVILVFARTIEDQIQKGFLLSMGSPVTVRLLAESNMINCLTGKTDEVISEMREVTGADINILREELVQGASDNDVVVQITGEFERVQNALHKVTNTLREYLLANEVPVDARTKSDRGVSVESVKGNFSTRRKSAFLSRRLLPKNAWSQAGSIKENGKSYVDSSENLELGRGNKLATIRNTTVEIEISEHVFSSVYGEDGGNLDRIRQISGAKVEVYDPSVGESLGRVVISGTPDQAFAAQSLLQAFIQTGQRTPQD